MTEGEHKHSFEECVLYFNPGNGKPEMKLVSRTCIICGKWQKKRKDGSWEDDSDEFDKTNNAQSIENQ